VVSPGVLLWGLLLVIAVQRVSELRLAKRNLDWAVGEGGRLVAEPHYWMFFVLHTGWLLAWPLEAWLVGGESGPQLGGLWWLFLLGFVAAEGLRYWAIASLGRRWNTRIVVLDGAPLVRRGPYRFLAHPNYVAVALELAAVPLVFGAWITALVCTVLNAALLLGLRIPAEMAAIRGAAAVDRSGEDRSGEDD
jgi:methyltransferase